jgi:anti-sigma factor RsiW
MDYLEGVLPAEVRAALDEHVAGCPRCAAFVASYLETPRILREATAATLPADVEASLRAFLRARTPAFRLH